MTKEEFKQFVGDTEEILNIKVNDKQYLIWYKALSSYTLREANIMVEKAYQYEQKSRVGLSDILKYKMKEQNQTISTLNVKNECPYCSYGVIVAEKEVDGVIYDFTYRCGCVYGKNLPFPKANREHILSLINRGGGRYTITMPRSDHKYYEMAKKYIGNV